MERILTNLTGLVRNATLEGRDYLVVPMIMAVEGVLDGSCGPLYYPAEELAKCPGVWNHKPVVVYHPEIGKSACDPEVIDRQKVGVIMNTEWKDGKLRAEAWIDPERANQVDPRILQAITANRMMELSTGLITENENKPGTWNGRHYTAIARNYRPDHLAILPDQIGACSIADGAGFLRYNQAAESLVENLFVLNQSKNGNDGQGGTPQDDGGNKMDKKKAVDFLVANSESWNEDDRDDLMAVADGTLQKLVAQVENQKKKEEEEAENKGKDKKKDVQNTTPEPKPEPTTDPAPVANQTQPATLESYVANAPAEIKEVLNESLRALAEERNALVEKITANEGNALSKEELIAMPLNTLRGITKLLPAKEGDTPAPVANADPRAMLAQAFGMTNNAQAQEPLTAPAMDFSGK